MSDNEHFYEDNKPYGIGMGYITNPYIESELDAMKKKDESWSDKLNKGDWLNGMFDDFMKFNWKDIKDVILIILKSRIFILWFKIVSTIVFMLISIALLFWVKA